MSNNVIASFPAYDILKNETLHWQTKQPVLKADDKIAFPFETKRYGTMWKIFTISSVASYALKNNECPIEAYEKAKERGHKTHFVFGNAVSLTAEKRAKEFYYGFQFGETCHFEGKIFRFVKESNDNVGLELVQ